MTDRLGPRDGTLSFDLAEGRVRLGGQAQILLPASMLLAIVGAATIDVRRVLGQTLGTSIGRVATIRMKEEDFAAHLALVDASPEAALSEMTAAWALAGLGGLGMERWGRAIVMTTDNAPLGPEGDEFLEGVLEGAIEEATGRQVQVMRLASRKLSSVRGTPLDLDVADFSRWEIDGVAHEPPSTPPATPGGTLAPDVLRQTLPETELVVLLSSTRSQRPATFGELLATALDLGE